MKTPPSDSRTNTPRRGSGRGGYILVEATVALVLLSLGAYAVHGTIRQALITRGQAQDYTQARFLLERITAEVALQPMVKAESQSGVFGPEFSRFSWSYTLSKVDMPLPQPPPIPPQDWVEPEDFEYRVEYLGSITATVTWQRAGQPYSESLETLFNPFKLWQPPEVE
ncbi:MAG: hypothetical protein QGG73_02355 [Candidatus Hydrogenedentes bacterium]|jgi:hypothetical protein|nr:hypothetical protein [Candidatus Hydrogenedentota bacterium]